MYEPNCGLDQLLMSWGHDEYLYQLLKFNGAKLPDEALYMIRFVRKRINVVHILKLTCTWKIMVIIKQQPSTVVLKKWKVLVDTKTEAGTFEADNLFLNNWQFIMTNA